MEAGMERANLDRHRAEQMILTDAEPRIERNDLELVIDSDVHPLAVMRRQTSRARRDATVGQHGEHEGAIDLDVRSRLELALGTDDALRGVRRNAAGVHAHWTAPRHCPDSW